MRVPTLASNIEAYSLAIRDGENGLLADNSIDDWITKILWAINNRRELSNLVANAASDLTDLSITRSAEIKRQSSLLKLIENELHHVARMLQ